MMMMKNSTLLLLVAAAAAAAVVVAPAAAQFPVPPRALGWAMGQAGAKVTIDAYIDLMCPDTAAAWPALHNVTKHYSGSDVNVVLHLFPLPYHHNSFYANQGVHVQSANGQDVFQWVATMLTPAVQLTFGNAQTAQQTSQQVIANMGAVSEKYGLATQEQFIAGIGDRTLNLNTREEWKYGCSRGITGTPLFHINGVLYSGDTPETLAQWTDVLDPLLQQH
eukprot:TRINITY_DN66360_c3_g1_i1.p2 TRINITY_DN66360_c3_g1~~TRINITY_DN66360_c3_g1_i1.p2  ORF type:complete len:221 (+),score=102.86 TRINITY_DN66360_c3_g1_i1:1-663(+)